MGTRIVPDRVPGAERAGNGGPGVLTLAGVPIGQAEDAPARLAEALANADVVAAEDTRRVRQLAVALDVRLAGRVVSYYDVIEVRRAAELVTELTAGRDVLVVTDAGMPAISDPGYRLVAAAAAAGIRVTAVPGPSAVTTALAVSGLPTDRFCFEGFPPRKRGERARRFGELAPTRARSASSSRPAGSRRPWRSCGLARRRPGGGRLPGADQDPRGDRARPASRACRLGGRPGGLRRRPR